MADARLFCNKCGQENNAQASFCVRCGASLPGVPAGAVSGTVVPSYGTRYGGFWLRVVAAILDAVLVGVVLIPVNAILFGASAFGMGMGRWHPGQPFNPAILGVFLLMGGIRVVANWIYEAWLTSSSWQATIGKKVVQLKVTDLNGQRISFARATGRHFAKWLSTIIFFVGFIMVGFTERKQGLHDMIAGTLVQKQ
jgi:uncharacterized RDD family membrane protein YckC